MMSLSVLRRFWVVLTGSLPVARKLDGMLRSTCGSDSDYFGMYLFPPYWEVDFSVYLF